jgi:hypothetical protein
LKRANFRIGFRHPFPLLPNVAIFTISISEDAGHFIIDLAEQMKARLRQEQADNIANYFVAEFR